MPWIEKCAQCGEPFRIEVAGRIRRTAASDSHEGLGGSVADPLRAGVN